MKLVIRRLPPTMSEEEFVEQVSPLPEYDYFSYFPPDISLGQYAFCRAYINFINYDDLVTFRDKFDNYVFLDKNGHEYLAVVENSMWHKSPKNGPFYTPPANPNSTNATTGSSSGGGGQTSSTSTATTTKERDSLMGTIEADKDYLEFVDKLDKQKKRVNNSVPSSTLEANLDELTNSSSIGNKNNQKVMTPLLEFVKQKFEQASCMITLSATNTNTTSTTTTSHANKNNQSNNNNNKTSTNNSGKNNGGERGDRVGANNAGNNQSNNQNKSNRIGASQNSGGKLNRRRNYKGNKIRDRSKLKLT